MNLYDVLAERGFIAQSTDAEISKRLSTPVVAYCGFDPTADSLHVGSLVPIMGLRWLQQCGHKPLVLVGGATGLVGDPSGKTEARKMLTLDEIAHNARSIAAQIGRVVRFGDGAADAKLVNNADWLAGLTWIDLLRSVGPHFSVNRMLTMDSVKGRMENGITFLEFNYMVMQGYDFWHLAKTEGCSLQLGGQDQWGNIVQGIELGRRKDDLDLAGLTFPLVTKADGGKFGKSEKGNIWLSAERTPVYDFYQFWRNTADSDLRKFLGFFTILPMAEVDTLLGAGSGAELNRAKEVLAYEVTRLIHGEEAATTARDSARRAFGGAGDATGEQIPHAPLGAGELAAGVGLVALVVRAGFAASNGEARRLIEGGGISLHDEKVADAKRVVGSADARDGRVVLKAGKKRLFRFDIE